MPHLSKLMSETPLSAPPSVSVSELNRAVAVTLQSNFALMWVSGELSAITRAASGHWYFTLKDNLAQVRCVMYRNRAQLCNIVPKEGEQLLVRATVSFYEPRGEFQLLVESIRKAGVGDLYEAFLKLKAALQAEGLFDASRKKSLPWVPFRVGVVTSPQAAALADVIRAIRRRAPYVRIVVYPTLVQGEQAAFQIASALDIASQRNEVDVLLLVRGGGSIEDLWAYNTEPVARAISRCQLPVISGVGHETDTTVADFVADLRAATPTAAAELACPAREELLARIDQAHRRARRIIQHALLQSGQRLDRAVMRLKSPAQRWAGMGQQLEQLSVRLAGAAARQLRHERQHVRASAQALHDVVVDTLTDEQRRLRDTAQTMQVTIRQHLVRAQDGLERHQAVLQALSPQRVLERGYAVVQSQDGGIIRSSQQAEPGQQVAIQLAKGRLTAQVTQRTDAALD